MPGFKSGRVDIDQVRRVLVAEASPLAFDHGDCTLDSYSQVSHPGILLIVVLNRLCTSLQYISVQPVPGPLRLSPLMLNKQNRRSIETKRETEPAVVQVGGDSLQLHIDIRLVSSLSMGIQVYEGINRRPRGDDGGHEITTIAPTGHPFGGT